MLASVSDHICKTGKGSEEDSSLSPLKRSMRSKIIEVELFYNWFLKHEHPLYEFISNVLMVDKLNILKVLHQNKKFHDLIQKEFYQH